MTISETIGKLFGSIDRVKILRLFMMNPGTVFTKASISRRSKVPLSTVNRELRALFEIHFIRAKVPIATEDAPGKSKGWQFDPSFSLTAPLKALIFPTAPFTKEEILKKFKNTGKIKLIIVAGVLKKEL
ncbi:MAG: hypothetical protein HZA95_03995, partial [Candidatus Vogelbacteria bacterium]|nr:hypothetical protein [Candidatus Vogelbacteria bacterium]